MRTRGVIDLPAQDRSAARSPLVLLPGFGETPRSFGPFITALHEATGRRTIFVGSPRWGAQCQPDPGYPQALLRLAEHAASQLRGLGVQQATGIFHSMGSVTGLIAAYRNPGLFKRVVLVCGAGHLTGDRLSRLIGAVTRKAVQTTKTARSHPDPAVRQTHRAALLDGRLYLLANPWRGLAEAQGLAKYNTRHLIEAVQANGTAVWAVLGAEDVVFQLKPVSTALSFLPTGHVITVPNRPHDLHLWPDELTALLSGHQLV